MSGATTFWVGGAVFSQKLFPRDLLYIEREMCPTDKAVSLHQMEETPMGHVCAVNVPPGPLFHTGGTSCRAEVKGKLCQLL